MISICLFLCSTVFLSNFVSFAIFCYDAFVTRQSEPFAAPTFFLDGRLGQRVWVVPSKALVIVRTGKDHPDWDDAKLPNLLIRGLVD